jgi:predicted transcriptional regulator
VIVWQRRDGTRIELDGERFRALRLSTNQTQADVAEHIGCTSAAVSSWETETRCPSLPQIERIVDLFGKKLERSGALRVVKK